MRRFRENIYLVSSERAYFGRILTGRSRHPGFSGQDLFAFYRISGSEAEYIEQCLSDPVHKAVAVWCRKTNGPLIFFKQFYFEAAMLLAVEPRFPKELVQRLLEGGIFPEILVSEKCRPTEGIPIDYLACLFNQNEKTFCSDRRAYRYLANLFERIGSLEFHIPATQVKLAFFEKTAETVLSLTGVSSTIGGKDTFRSDGRLIFDFMSCSALLLSMGFLVREHSSSRCMEVSLIDVGESLTMLSVSFCADRKKDTLRYKLENLTDMISSAHDCNCSFTETDCGFAVRLLPYYSDVGMLSLKESPPLFEDLQEDFDEGNRIS